MKKLIAIAVVFALAAGAAFAVDLGGTVFGTVNVLQGDKDAAGDDIIVGSANFNRLRLEGAGEAGDGKFGGWIRLGDGTTPEFFGLAWWKPIDQLKITIGGNPDGFWGKDSTAGWMFYQTATDVGVTFQGDNVWDGTGLYGQGLKYRNAFYRGFGDNGLLLEIKPIDMIGINIALPFFNHAGEELKDIFGGLVAQLDLNFDFGNIAITYEGEGSYIQKGNNGWNGANGGTLFASYEGSFGDLGLNVGLGFQLNDEDKDGTDKGASPLAVGLGLKYASDAFGIKFRAAASFGSENDKTTKILTDVLPYYKISDNVVAFVSVGLGLASPEEGDSVTGFHINPYIQVGEEWGAKFLAGFKLMSDGVKDADDKTTINWSVPIAIMISF